MREEPLHCPTAGRDGDQGTNSPRCASSFQHPEPQSPSTPPNFHNTCTSATKHAQGGDPACPTGCRHRRRQRPYHQRPCSCRCMTPQHWTVLFVVWLTGHPHASHHSTSIPRSLVRRLRGWPGNCSFRFPGPMVQYFAPAPPLPLPHTLRRGGLFPSSDVGSEGGQWEGIACDMSKGKGAM